MFKADATFFLRSPNIVVIIIKKSRIKNNLGNYIKRNWNYIIGIKSLDYNRFNNISTFNNFRNFATTHINQLGDVFLISLYCLPFFFIWFILHNLVEFISAKIFGHMVLLSDCIESFVWIVTISINILSTIDFQLSVLSSFFVLQKIETQNPVNDQNRWLMIKIEKYGKKKKYIHIILWDITWKSQKNRNKKLLSYITYNRNWSIVNKKYNTHKLEHFISQTSFSHHKTFLCVWIKFKVYLGERLKHFQVKV